MNLYTLCLLVVLALVVGPLGALALWAGWVGVGRVLQWIDPDPISGR